MDLLSFLGFNRRVRRALFECLRGLPGDDFTRDVGISFGSIRNVLFHTMRVEDFWVNEFLRGQGMLVQREKREEVTTVRDLVGLWDEVSSRSEDYIRSLSPEDLGKIRERPRDGDVARKTVEEYLFTFMVHEVYHKGEVLAVLWQMGVEPPAVDYWRY